MATILGLAPGTVKSLACLYDPGTAPRPLHDGPHDPTAGFSPNTVQWKMGKMVLISSGFGS